MKYYRFESCKKDKHITRARMVHEFTDKKTANDARKELIRDGYECTQIVLCRL